MTSMTSVFQILLKTTVFTKDGAGKGQQQCGNIVDKSILRKMVRLL